MQEQKRHTIYYTGHQIDGGIHFSSVVATFSGNLARKMVEINGLVYWDEVNPKPLTQKQWHMLLPEDHKCDDSCYNLKQQEAEKYEGKVKAFVAEKYKNARKRRATRKQQRQNRKA